MLFNVGNMAAWAGCLSVSFGWDERAVPAVLVLMMNAVLVVLGDATVSNVENGTRRIFLIFTTLMCFSGTCTVARVWGGGYRLQRKGWLEQIDRVSMHIPDPTKIKH